MKQALAWKNCFHEMFKIPNCESCVSRKFGAIWHVYVHSNHEYLGNTSCFKTSMQEHNVRNINFIHWWSCEVFITFIDRIVEGIYFHQGLGQSTDLQRLFSIINYNKKKHSCEENMIAKRYTLLEIAYIRLLRTHYHFSFINKLLNCSQYPTSFSGIWVRILALDVYENQYELW